MVINLLLTNVQN